MPEMNPSSENNPSEKQESPAVSSSRAIVVSARNGSNGANAPNESAFKRLGKYVGNRVKSILSQFGSSEAGVPPRREPNYRDSGRHAAAHTEFEPTGWASLRQQGPTEEGGGSKPESRTDAKAASASDIPKSEPRPETISPSTREKVEEAIRNSRAWKIATAVSFAVALALGIETGGVTSQATAPDGGFNKQAAKVAWFFWSKKTGYDAYVSQRSENSKLATENGSMRNRLDVASSNEKAVGEQLKKTESKLAKAEERLKQFWTRGKAAAAAIAKGQEPKHEAKLAKASASKHEAKVAARGKSHSHAKLAKAHKSAKPVSFEQLAISQQAVIDNRLKELMRIQHPDWKIALRNEGLPQSVIDSKDYEAYVRKQQYQLKYLNREIQLAKESTREKNRDTELAAKRPEVTQPEIAKAEPQPEAKSVQPSPAPDGKVDEKKLAETTSGNPPSGVPEKPQEATAKGGESMVAAQAGSSEGGTTAQSSGTSAEASKSAGSEIEKPAPQPQPIVALQPGRLKKAEVLSYIEKANEQMKSEKLDNAKLHMKEVRVDGQKAYRIFLSYAKDGKDRLSYFTLPTNGKTPSGKLTRNFSYVASIDTIKQWAEKKVDAPQAKAAGKRAKKAIGKKAVKKVAKKKAEK